MNTPTPAYIPVLCEFHDHLEAMATTRAPVRMAYTDATGVAVERMAVIADVYARGGAEYLATDSGETIRLNRLLAVDGIHPTDG